MWFPDKDSKVQVVTCPHSSEVCLCVHPTIKAFFVIRAAALPPELRTQQAVTMSPGKYGLQP